MNNISDKIKKLRKQSGFSPSELADRSGLSSAYISKLENGQYKSLSLKTSKLLAEGLGMTLREFLEKMDFLEDKTKPSLKMLNQALRDKGYTEKQIEAILDYAEYIKKKESYQ